MNITKNFNTRGDLTIFPNENITSGKGILFTNFLKETTENFGVNIEDTSLKFINNSNEATFAFNGETTTMSITSSFVNIIGNKTVNGDSTTTGNCSVLGTFSAFSGVHSFINDTISENVINIKNTTSSGYSSIQFYDELNTERLSIGVGNSSSSLFTSQAFINIKNGYDLVIKTSQVGNNAVRINSNGVVNILNTTMSNSASTGALVVSGGLGISESITLAKYIDIDKTPAPSNPNTETIRYYTDTNDSLLKSKSSSGTITTYQPTNTKGDLLTHNGTTQVRLPVDPINDSYVISNSMVPTGLSWFNKAYAYVRDQKPAGTNGGAVSSGSWINRELNTITSYPSGQNFISLDATLGRVSLGPGNYYVKASSPAVNVSNHTCRLVDWTDLVVLFAGTSERTSSGGLLTSNNGSFSKVSGIISVTTAKTIGIQHRVDNSQGSTGLGVATGFQTEVYTVMEIFKI